MQKRIVITTTISTDGVLDADEKLELSRQYLGTSKSIANAIAHGSLRVVNTFTVGTEMLVEPTCRICGKTRSVLEREGFELRPFDSTTGIRPVMEAALPPSHTVYWTCGCDVRYQQQKSAADRKELERRTPISVNRNKSMAELEAELERVQEELKELGGDNGR